MRKVIAVAVACATASVAQEYAIVTVAGGGPVVGAHAGAVTISAISRIAVSNQGTLYFGGSNRRIYEVDTSGIITKIFTAEDRIASLTAIALDQAGNVYAYARNSATGLPQIIRIDLRTRESAVLVEDAQHLEGLAVDSAGNVYASDALMRCIRRFAPDGSMTEVAGSLTATEPGDGGPAVNASLAGVKQLAVDFRDRLYFSEERGRRVRQVDLASGIITTIAGNGAYGSGGDGGPAISASLHPGALTVDSAGNLFVVDTFKNLVRKVAADTGIMTTVAGGGEATLPDGKLATDVRLSPFGLALDSGGNLLIANHSTVLKIDRNSGTVSRIAGSLTGITEPYRPSDDGGPAHAANFSNISQANGITPWFTLDSAGNLFLPDSNTIRQVAADTGVVSTVAGGGTVRRQDGMPAREAALSISGVLADAFTGDLFVSGCDRCFNNSSPQIFLVTKASGQINSFAGTGSGESSGDGGPASAAGLNGVRHMTQDLAGNLFIVENRRIRKISAVTGVITTVAGNGSSLFSGDDGPATSAGLESPCAVAVHPSGDLYFTERNRLRKVAVLSGMISTVAGRYAQFGGDGGPAQAATFTAPCGIAADPAGNILIADGGRVRKIDMATGIIRTIAGGGRNEVGEGVSATSVILNDLGYLVVDKAGSIFAKVGDVVRMIVPMHTVPMIRIATSHQLPTADSPDLVTYRFLVSNLPAGGPTSGWVTMTGTFPSGLALLSMSGEGWDCSSNTCRRSDPLGGGGSYPEIVAIVRIAGPPAASQVAQAVVTGGGMLFSAFANDVLPARR